MPSAFSAAGDARGGEFRVNTALAADQQYSTVAMDAAGNFVVTWASKDQDGNGWGIYAAPVRLRRQPADGRVPGQHGHG